ncbi:hypothetical protein [Cohnella sp. JJ-181]|uniref:hypothetical protein n=1 Tax=Cohnella rhizoplanae TaxID=2974897 RepID=UPI0022FFA22A|nr:hypothetical protein [Cohnella sp. JJ-181]CAI6087216.1 hypothetical protein COHCIP112018_05395 [Cohnella sp. JJ-181]
MAADSYPFPMYSGLLEPGHYKNIGSAIWLFLWCVSATTAEKEKDGIVWGIVLGNKPIRSSDLEPIFGVTERTIRSWIRSLEEHGYIRVTRAPKGLILTVKNSKKWSRWMAERPEVQSERPEGNFRSLDSDRKNTSDHSDERPEENFRSNKDIIKDLAVDIDTAFSEIMNAYCSIHQKLDIQVRPLDVKLMYKMIAMGVPFPLIIRVMQQIHAGKMAKGERISSFAFYEGAILDAWKTEQAITEGVPIPEGVPLPPVAIGEPLPRKSKQQRELEELQRMREEAERVESL